MKRILVGSLLLVLSGAAALAQGTIVIASNLGATIYPVCLPDGTKATGSNYSVEIFVSNTDPANKIGSTMTLAANGRFSQSGSQIVPGAAPGSIVDLIARTWDNTTGATYETALIKGAATFKSPVLGGDVDGDPSTPPVAALPMVTGKPDGFQGICFIPEPRVWSLVGGGVAALLLADKRIRRRNDS